MAIAYDFDGTLADGNMQEAQFLPDIGMKPKDFWKEVNQLAKENQGDNVLIYMSRMLRKADAAAFFPVRDFINWRAPWRAFKKALETLAIKAI